MPDQQYRTPQCRAPRSVTSGGSSNAGPSNAAMQDRLRRSQHAAQLTGQLCGNEFESTGLRPLVFERALNAFEAAFSEGLSTSTTVTIIDYELHSSKKRLWVIDLEQQSLLFHEHAAHGRGSDRDHDGYLDFVSNRDGSHQSNVGLLRTAETYTGAHGYSMRMDGLEAGFNDNARSRNIVMHPSSYVNDAWIDRYGKSGRSKGCPSLDPNVSGELIQSIKGGSLVFAYYPDPEWLERSTFLNRRD